MESVPDILDTLAIREIEMEIPAMIASPNSLGTKIERTISFLRDYKRVIASLLIFAFCAYPLTDPGRFLAMRVAYRVILVTITASQFFWIPRVVGLGEQFIRGKSSRTCLRIIVGLVYLFFFACNFGLWNIPRGDSTHLTLRSAVLDGAWSWWLVGSVLGFGLVSVFWVMDGVVRAMYREAATEPQPLMPDQAYRLTIHLGDIHHTFRAGNRIQVDVTSSNFPRRARNTNSGNPVLAHDAEADIRVATNTVYHDEATPSCVEMLVLTP